MAVDLNAEHERRVAIIGVQGYPTPENMAAWDAIRLTKYHKLYSERAQDMLHWNASEKWAAWDEAAWIIGVEIVARLMGISWEDAANLPESEASDAIND